MITTSTSSMDKLLITLIILNIHFNLQISEATSPIAHSSYNYSYAFANTFAWKTFHNHTITTVTNPIPVSNLNPIPVPVPVPNLNLNPIPISNPIPNPIANPNLNLNPLIARAQIQQPIPGRPSNTIQTTKIQPINNGYLAPLPLNSAQPSRAQGQVISYSMSSNNCKDGTQRCTPTTRSTPPPLIHNYKPNNKNNNNIPPSGVQQPNNNNNNNNHHQQQQNHQPNNNNNNNNSNIRPVNEGNYIIREAPNYPIEIVNGNAPEHPDTAIFKRVIEGYQADQLDLFKNLIEQQIQAMKIMSNQQQKLSG